MAQADLQDIYKTHLDSSNLARFQSEAFQYVLMLFRARLGRSRKPQRIKKNALPVKITDKALISLT
jgi:hypothetical protein